jgi:hypothetical protein
MRSRTRRHPDVHGPVTPRSRPGDIYTVIDFARSGDTAEATTIEEVMGGGRREMTVVPHDYCAQTTPTGVVVRYRHYTADSVPLTVTTSGRRPRSSPGRHADRCNASLPSTGELSSGGASSPSPLAS